MAPVGKEYACSEGDPGDLGLIPGSGRSPRVGHGNPLPVFLPGESSGQRSRWATVHGVTDCQTRQHKCSKQINICTVNYITPYFFQCFFLPYVFLN